MESTFIKNSPVSQVDEIATSLIIKKYNENFGMDVSDSFKGVETIKTYLCEKSGYRFYHPFTVAGGSKFYEELQKFDWYYMPWKWEHQEFSKLIKNADRILDVGCGQGGFIKKILKEYDQIDCVGLELNESAIFKMDRFEVINETIESYSSKTENENAFDLVCSFQVLEHISQVNSFIEGKIKCTKVGGKMVICVPNNDSFINLDSRNALNMPPHHMGLWDTQSLKAIETHFNIKLVDILYEPLMDYHFEWYTKLRLKDKYGELIAKAIVLFYRLTGIQKLINKKLFKKRHKIKGHSILAVYEKV